MVEVVVGPDLVCHADRLHVENLGARQLVGVLNWRFSDLLVANRVVDCVLDRRVALGRAEVFVSLVRVLVSL